MCAVFTAHLIQNIGGYGPPQMVTGGSILQYAPSLEVRLSRVNAESNIEKSAKGASMIKLKAEIIKSRFGTLGKRVTFDLDMQSGLDRYAGLIDILRDYGFIIAASSDLEKQIEEKSIPKKSSGWWMFKPWVDEEVGEKAKALHEKLIAEKITTSGKFREDAIKEYCKQYDWFLPEVQNLLSSIYNDELLSNAEKIEAGLLDDIISSDEPNEALKELLNEDKTDTEEIATETSEKKRRKGVAVDIQEA